MGGGDSTELIKDSLGYDFRHATSKSKISSELGWEPRVDFVKGLSAP